MWTFRFVELCPRCLRLPPLLAFSGTTAAAGMAPVAGGGKLTKLVFSEPSSSITAARMD